MNNQYLLYTTESFARANIIKGMLEENNIPAIILNKQSSSYVNFGEMEIYVPNYFKEIAEALLHNVLIN